jgi:hypothetical protein
MATIMPRVLFISPKFNGYELDIINSFEKKGFLVDYFYEKPDSLIFKFIPAFFKSLKAAMISNYQRRILIKCQGNYELLFVVKGELLSQSFLNRLCTNATFNSKVLYLWDSIKNCPNSLKVSTFFDDVYSFDPLDSDYYGFVYKPLFYSNLYLTRSDIETRYDFFFVGVLHSARVQSILQFKKIAQDNNLKCYFKLYISLYSFISQKLFTNDLKGVTLEDVIFKALPSIQVAEKLHQSKCVIDLAHPGQAGLTIRTFEALGASKKLITNNNTIKNEHFYCPNNISTSFDKESIIRFFSNEHLPKMRFLELSIDEWINEFI